MEPPNTSGGGASCSYCPKTTFAPPYDTVCSNAQHTRAQPVRARAPPHPEPFRGTSSVTVASRGVWRQGAAGGLIDTHLARARPYNGWTQHQRWVRGDAALPSPSAGSPRPRRRLSGHRSHISLIYQAHISIALICQYQANIKPYQPDIAFSQYQADIGLICQYQADFASLSLLKSSLNRHISLILAPNIKRSNIRLILAYQVNISLILAH